MLAVRPTIFWRRRGLGGLPRVRRDGAAGAAVSPLALAADVMAGGVDEGGAPGLVLGEVGLVPGTGVVSHAVELEGEDAGFVCGCSSIRGADFFCKKRQIFLISFMCATIE